jgi:SNF2 family DNA or RNA helicase
MKSTDHLMMPELVSSEYTVLLSDQERQRYNELKQDLVLQIPDGDITAANAAALTGKLCQTANGAIYTDDGGITTIHDRKLDALEDIIEAAGSKPILVAYWFKHDLARITERLQKLHVLFSKLDGADSIRKWNTGELPVALIHPASAGHGLNLQSGGSCIVWFGLTWSLELYQQTNARLWRQGQNAETVVVQHIVAKDTIDERILKVLSKKDSTQAALIDAVKADLQI